MEFKISLVEACLYSSISKKTLIKTFNLDDEIDENIPSIPLLKLPANVVHEYFMDHHRGIYLNVDFTSYYLVHGRRKTLKLFEELKYLEYYYYRHLYFFGGEDTIENYLFKVINLTKYQFENKKKQYDITPAKSLFHLPNKSFRYLCPKAKAIIENERVIYNNANVESIYGVLKAQQELNNCDECLFNYHNNLHKLFEEELIKQEIPYTLPKCFSKSQSRMITPGSSHPIADYLKTVPKSLINYSELFENNLQKFKHRYLYKIIHEEISSVNDIWFIDSHQLPIWVKYFINESEFIIIKPWITLIIDGCSDCVVSCVLTKVPNHNATASCIAHAVAITDDDIFFGTCNYLICDNGREFKNTYISNHKVVEDWPPYEEYDFELSDSLLDVLRITQINNLPYQPWNNKIEPCHKAIDRELAKLHPNGFSNKKHGLKPRQIYRIENNPKLSTFEELADLIYNYVIININNSPANKDKISRLDKYLNSPKIESFVPSFASISLLLENRENVKVKQASVKYKNTAYYGDCLNLLPDKAEVTIYQSYDINYPYLQAFYKSENTCRYLGTLYPKEPISFVENNEYKKEVQFNIQQRGLNIYRKRYEAILQIGELVSSPLMYASKIKDPFKGNDINKDVSLSYYIKKQKELELDSYYLKQNELIIKKELIKSIATNINSIKYTK